LRGQLCQESRNEEDRERAFRSLLDAAKRQHGLLGAEQRWNTSR